MQRMITDAVSIHNTTYEKKVAAEQKMFIQPASPASLDLPLFYFRMNEMVHVFLYRNVLMLNFLWQPAKNHCVFIY